MIAQQVPLHVLTKCLVSLPAEKQPLHEPAAPALHKAELRAILHHKQHPVLVTPTSTETASQAQAQPLSKLMGSAQMAHRLSSIEGVRQASEHFSQMVICTCAAVPSLVNLAYHQQWQITCNTHLFNILHLRIWSIKSAAYHWPTSVHQTCQIC